MQHIHARISNWILSKVFQPQVGASWTTMPCFARQRKPTTQPLPDPLHYSLLDLMPITMDNTRSLSYQGNRIPVNLQLPSMDWILECHVLTPPRIVSQSPRGCSPSHDEPQKTPRLGLMYWIEMYRHYHQHLQISQDALQNTWNRGDKMFDDHYRVTRSTWETTLGSY